MSKKKSAAVVILIMLVHFGLMVALVISRIPCGMQPHCASAAGDFVAELLAFPMNLVGMGLSHLGVDVDEATKRYLGGEIVVLYLINSLLASLIIWFGIVKPILRRRYVRSYRAG